MNGFAFSDNDRGELVKMIAAKIGQRTDCKALEFGWTNCFLGRELRPEFGYLAASDRFSECPEQLKADAEKLDLMLIPYEEIGEDCYFGRFHFLYSAFAMHECGKHLVDDILILRRLIIKGGRIVFVDEDANGFAAYCEKQLGRCGFLNISTEHFEMSGKSCFLISAEK